ncbi:MAG: winged helix-turn-helix domain-containing protein [Thermodesulfovibrionales bacterium]|nr:winged helix-turn-helix domain-containing protein [Thermodesulfovibrionales bacterium]
MLKTLFSSSIRAEMLELLLNRPDDRFYIRELASILKKNPSGIKRELDKLEEMDIVVSEKVANLKYFRANKQSQLFNELKSLISKSLGLPGALKSILKSNDIKTAFIYGPYAAGEDTPIVDLVVVGSLTPPLLAGIQELEKKFEKKINCNFINQEDFKIRKKKDPTLKRLVAEKRITLLGRV